MSSTLQDGKNQIEIVIANETMKRMKYLPAIIPSIVCLPLAIILGGLIVFIPILLLCMFFFGFVGWVANLDQVDKPDIYQIKPETNILLAQRHSMGVPDDINLSKIYFVKFINHKHRKRVHMKYYNNNEKWVADYSAPFFEKCNDEWQRLFDDIRKRIPEDAEVIVK